MAYCCQTISMYLVKVGKNNIPSGSVTFVVTSLCTLFVPMVQFLV